MNNNLIVGELDAISQSLKSALEQVELLRKNIVGNPVVKAEDVPSVMEKEAEKMNGVQKSVTDPVKKFYYAVEYEKDSKRRSEVFQSSIAPGADVGKLTQEVLDYLKTKWDVKKFTRISTINEDEINGGEKDSKKAPVEPKKKPIKTKKSIKQESIPHVYEIEYGNGKGKKILKFKSAYNVEKDADKIQKLAEQFLKTKGIETKEYEVFLTE